MNPLEKAIQSGVRANDMIGEMFARIGGETHPRGYAQSAYRNARRAIASALRENDRLAAVNDALLELRRAIEDGTESLFEGAQQAGAEESARQMRFYGITSPEVSRVSVSLSYEHESAVEAVLARVDAQSAAVRSMVLTNQTEEAILGGERAGALRASDVALTAAFWATALVWDAFDWWTRQFSRGAGFQKQAVAALDGKTTDCCLRVHAQVQPLDKPFRLTGTPRYADEVDWPGFHWYCRTAGVLYLPRFDDGLSAKMRDGADWFLRERAKGNRPDSSPADAFGQ